MWLLTCLLNFDGITDYYLMNALWQSVDSGSHGLPMEFKFRQSRDRYLGLHAALKEEDDKSYMVEKRNLNRRSSIDFNYCKEIDIGFRMVFTV